MVAFLIRRLLWIIPVLFTVALVTFTFMHIAPGGPWDRNKPVPVQTRDALNRRFGLDRPLWFNPDASAAAAEQGLLAQAGAFFDSQFWNYMIDAAQGKLGPSYKQRGQEVQDILIAKLPYSLKLAGVALFFALLFGIPLGVLSAIKQHTIFDHGILAIATLGIAMPAFVIAPLSIVALSRVFDRPVVTTLDQWDGITAYFWPGLVLGLSIMSYIARLTRASMIDVKRQDYVRTARAKGLQGRTVIFRHMLRNSLIPVVTILGPAIATLITGSFIVESIFGVPGIGLSFVESVSARDYSMIMGTALFYALLVALGNLSVDIMYGLIDPRIRSQN